MNNRNKQSLVIFSLASLFLFGLVSKTDAKVINIGTTTDTIYMNGNIGIGTTVPGALLQVGSINSVSEGIIRLETKNVGGGARGWDIGVSATTDTYDYGFRIKDNSMASPALFIARDTGNVGIGTTNPLIQLHVQGSSPEILLDASSGTLTVGATVYPGLVAVANANGGPTSFLTGAYGGIYNTATTAGSYPFSSAGNLIIQSRGNSDRDINFVTGVTPSSKMTIIGSSGNVGIGITNPGASLDVSGTFRNSSATTHSLLGNSGNTVVMADNAGTLYNTPLSTFISANGLWGGTKNGSIWNGDAGAGNVGIGTMNPGGNLQIGDAAGTGGTGAVFSGWTGVSHGSLKMYAYANNVPTIQLSTANSGTGGGTTYFNSGNVGIGTASPSAKLDVRNETLNNAAFQTLATVFANVSNESYGETFDPAMSSFGLSFRRNWSSSVGSTNVAGIYGFSSGGWRGGMVFRTKNNTNAAGDTDVNAMVLSPVGNVGIGTTAPQTRVHSVGGDGVSAWVGDTNYYGGGKAFYDNTYGDVYGNGGAYGGAAVTNGNSPYSTWYAGEAGGYFKGGNGLSASGGGTGLVGIGGNGGTYSDGSATGGAGLYAKGGLNGDGVTRTFAGYFAGGNVAVMSGNVGIGTTNPGARLTVQTDALSSANSFRITDGTGLVNVGHWDGVSNRFEFSGKPTYFVQYGSGQYLAFGTAGSERMRILEGGNVGIGLTNPGTILDISGSFRNSTATTHSLLANSGNVVVLSDNAGTLYSTPLATFMSSGLWGGTKNGNIWNGDAGAGNVGIGTTAPGVKLDISGASRVTTGVLNSDDYFEKVFSNAINFPNAVANQAVDIRLGINKGFWGYIEVEANSTYANQNSVGKLTKVFAVGLQTDGTSYTNESRVSDAMGTIPDNISIGEVSWDAGNATWRIPISHIVSTGNNFSVRVRFFGNASGAKNVFDTINLSSVYTLTALPRSYVNFNGNVGIGKTSPGIALDVAGDISASMSVTASGFCMSSVCKTDWNNFVYQNTTPTLTGLNMYDSASVLAMNWGNITNVTKLTVKTIDPLYKINGINYSTFAASIAGGVKEEYVGKAQLTTKNTINNEFEAVIDFTKVTNGSDIWVWRKAVEFSKDNIEVLVTPYGELARVYYLINGDKLIFRSDKPVEISYRLIGKRLDWREWPTLANDQSETASFIIND